MRTLTWTTTRMTLANLEVLVMPTGEILCLGKTIGWVKQFSKVLTIKGEKES